MKEAKKEKAVWTRVSIGFSIAMAFAVTVNAEPIALVWADASNAVSPRSAERMQAETVRVLGDVGVVAAWVSDPPAESAERASVRYVIPANRQPLAAGDLGWTFGGKTMWISLPAIHTALGQGREVCGLPIEQAFILAFARIASHEILHSLLPGRVHGKSGLMAPGMHAASLTGPVALDEKWAAALALR